MFTLGDTWMSISLQTPRQSNLTLGELQTSLLMENWQCSDSGLHKWSLDSFDEVITTRYLLSRYMRMSDAYKDAKPSPDDTPRNSIFKNLTRQCPWKPYNHHRWCFSKPSMNWNTSHKDLLLFCIPILFMWDTRREHKMTCYWSQLPDNSDRIVKTEMIMITGSEIVSNLIWLHKSRDFSRAEGSPS